MFAKAELAADTVLISVETGPIKDTPMMMDTNPPIKFAIILFFQPSHKIWKAVLYLKVVYCSKVYKSNSSRLFMAIKELTIQVRISDEGVASAVKKIGFGDSASSHFEIIGILQNLIHLERQKLDQVAYAKK